MATKDNQMETENSGAVVEEHDHQGNSLGNLSTDTSQGLHTTKGIMLCYQHKPSGVACLSAARGGPPPPRPPSLRYCTNLRII